MIQFDNLKLMLKTIFNNMCGTLQKATQDTQINIIAYKL